jgi:type IV pilus assembly protein PilF
LRFGPAFACISRWIEAEPDSAEPIRWRAAVLERLNDNEGAMKDYRRALELDPDLTSVRLRLAEMLLERSDPDEALVHLEPLQRQYPDRPDIQARMGQCRFLQNHLEEARHLLESAVDKLPDDSVLLLTLARLEHQDGHPVEAEKWARRALKVDPTDAEAEFTLAASLQAQDRWDEAKAALEQFRNDTALLKRVAYVLQQDAENPSADPVAFAEVGAVFLPSNEQVGIYWLNRALQRDPGCQAAHKALAEHYERKGDLDKAAFHRRQLKSDEQATDTKSGK